MTLRNAPGANSATSDRKDDLTSLPMSEVEKRLGTGLDTALVAEATVVVTSPQPSAPATVLTVKVSDGSTAPPTVVSLSGGSDHRGVIEGHRDRVAICQRISSHDRDAEAVAVATVPLRGWGRRGRRHRPSDERRQDDQHAEGGRNPSSSHDSS